MGSARPACASLVEEIETKDGTREGARLKVRGEIGRGNRNKMNT